MKIKTQTVTTHGSLSSAPNILFIDSMDVLSTETGLHVLLTQICAQHYFYYYRVLIFGAFTWVAVVMNLQSGRHQENCKKLSLWKEKTVSPSWNFTTVLLTRRTEPKQQGLCCICAFVHLLCSEPLKRSLIHYSL